MLLGLGLLAVQPMWIVEHPCRSDISSHCPLVQEFWRFQRIVIGMRSSIDIMCHQPSYQRC